MKQVPLPARQAGWAPIKRPERLCATYRKQHGVRYASFLNRIGRHFWAIEFVIKNADYPDRDTPAKAMAEHTRYRNGRHRDQRLINAERRLLIAA